MKINKKNRKETFKKKSEIGGKSRLKAELFLLTGIKLYWIREMQYKKNIK